MSRSLLLIPLVLMACGTKPEPDTTVDTDDGVPEDTFVPPTNEDTDVKPDPNDSGTTFAWELEGRATVAPRAKLDGWQTLSAKWLKRGEINGPPRCMYQQRVRDWDHDPATKDLPNPISADQFDLCQGCEFAFTVTYTAAESVERYPWTVDSDTDDTNPPPADVVSTGKMNCGTLVGKQGAHPASDVPTDPQGWGFNAGLDGDSNPRTGIWLLWVDRYNAWSAYSYDVLSDYDPQAGNFTWKGMSQPYTYY